MLEQYGSSKPSSTVPFYVIKNNEVPVLELYHTSGDVTPLRLYSNDSSLSDLQTQIDSLVVSGDPYSVYPEQYGYLVGGDQVTNDTAIQNWLTALIGGTVIGRTVPTRVYTLGSKVSATGNFKIHSEGIFTATTTFTDGEMMELNITSGERTNIEMIRFNGNKNSNAASVTGLKISNGVLVNVRGVFDQCDIGLYGEGNFESNFVDATCKSCDIGVYCDQSGGGDSPDENRFRIKSTSCRTTLKFGSSTSGVYSAVCDITSQSGGEDGVVIVNRGKLVVGGMMRGCDKSVLVSNNGAAVFNSLYLDNPGDGVNPHMVIDTSEGVSGSVYTRGSTGFTGIWIKAVNSTSEFLLINANDDTTDTALRLGDVANAKTVTGFTLRKGSHLESTTGQVDLNLDNATLCNLHIGKASKITISSTSSYNEICTYASNLTVTNSRTQKDNIIFFDRILTSAQVSAITSPINGYRLKGDAGNMTSGEYVYVEGTGWVATRN